VETGVGANPPTLRYIFNIIYLSIVTFEPIPLPIVIGTLPFSLREGERSIIYPCSLPSLIVTGRVGEGLGKKKKRVGVDYKNMDRKMNQELQ
jgi:hypothetical protein